jgi:hypothetical protein
MLRYRTGVVLWALALLSATVLFVFPQGCPQVVPKTRVLVPETRAGKTYHRVAGKVVNSLTGKPVPRALVRLMESRRAVLTGHEGDFAFDRVPSGKEGIRVSKPGYFRGDQPVANDRPNEAPYPVEVGPEMASPVLKLLPEGIVSGTVRNNDGRPLGHAGIQIMRVQTVGSNRQLVKAREDVATDEDGHFRIGSLPPGQYLLRPPDYGLHVYYPLSEAAPLELAGGQHREINLTDQKTAARKPEPPTLLAATGGGPFQISGVLADALTGQPIRQARVTIASVAQRDAKATAITGENGRFVFPGLAAGKYTLMAEQRGYLTRLFNQHDEFSSAIAVGSGRESEEVLFRLPAECAVSGTVSDEAGEPLRDTWVRLYKIGVSYGEAGALQVGASITNDEGHYQISHLAPGKYFAMVMPRVWYAQRPGPEWGTVSRIMDIYPEEEGWSPLDVAYPITYYPGTTDEKAASPITLKSGERFVADIALRPVPAVHLHIAARWSGETPNYMNRLQLQRRPFDALPVDVAIDSSIRPSGDMEISGVVPGRYDVVFHDGARIQSGQIDAASSGEGFIEHEVVAVPGTAAVEFDGGIRPPPQEHLQVYDVDRGRGSSAYIQAAGEFQLNTPLEPGSYTVSMNGSSPEYIKSITASGGTVTGQTLEIDGSSPVHLNVLVANDRGAVSGVVLRDGKPLAGAMVMLVPPDPVHSRLLVRRDQSDSDGTFTLGQVVPGKYTLLAIENGWELEWRNPAVLKPYLSAAETLEVQPNGKHNVTVGVQMKR